MGFVRKGVITLLARANFRLFLGHLQARTGGRFNLGSSQDIGEWRWRETVLLPSWTKLARANFPHAEIKKFRLIAMCRSAVESWLEPTFGFFWAICGLVLGVDSILARAKIGEWRWKEIGLLQSWLKLARANFPHAEIKIVRLIAECRSAAVGWLEPRLVRSSFRLLLGNL